MRLLHTFSAKYGTRVPEEIFNSHIDEPNMNEKNEKILKRKLLALHTCFAFIAQKEPYYVMNDEVSSSPVKNVVF